MSVVDALRENPALLETLSPREKVRALELLQQYRHAVETNKIDSFYPETGPLRRELYPKHVAFLNAGAKYRERAAIAANQIGKSEGLGAFEVACHMTGQYPGWWEGRRFDKPVRVWCGGDTNFTVRDNCQTKLLGPPTAHGTGMIRKSLLGKCTKRPGVPDGIESFRVKHILGGESVGMFKSYDQGRKAWQGPVIDVVWMDEEPPEDIYSEALMRTINSDGLVIVTFTPLEGWTSVVNDFLKNGVRVA